MKKIVLCLIAILLSSLMMAQNSFKTMRITYLWDVTLSMKGYKGGSPYIYDKVVNVLVDDINSIHDERTEIVVVPFQDKVCDMWRARATADGKKAMIDKIQNYDNNLVTNTCISLPLQYAIDNIFTTDRVDIMKLMTDGKDNVNVPRLNAVLDKWCDMARQKDVYGYYILLTEAAKDGDLSLKLKQICNFESVDVSDNLSGINEIVQLTARGGDAVRLNLRGEYNMPKRLEFVQYLGETAPEGFKIHFKVRDNAYIKLDETVELRGDNSVELHPTFLVSQESLMLMPESVLDFGIWVDYEPDASMASGRFAYTRLLSNAFKILFVNKPEKTVRIYVK